MQMMKCEGKNIGCRYETAKHRASGTKSHAATNPIGHHRQLRIANTVAEKPLAVSKRSESRLPPARSTRVSLTSFSDGVVIQLSSPAPAWYATKISGAQ